MLSECDHAVTYDRARSDRFEVYCLECGEVIDSVTYEELMAGNPAFQGESVPVLTYEQEELPW